MEDINNIIELYLDNEASINSNVLKLLQICAITNKTKNDIDTGIISLKEILVCKLFVKQL